MTPRPDDTARKPDPAGAKPDSGAATPAPAAAATGLGVSAAGRVRVGDALIASGAITREQLDQALRQQRASGRMLGELLVEQGVISNIVLVRALAQTLGVPGCVIRHGLTDPALLKLVGEEECTRLKVLPMFRVHGVLTVAMAEPQSLPTIDRLRQLTGLKIRSVLALEANIHEYVKKYASGNVDIDAFLTSLAEQDVEVVEREQVDEGPVTDLDRMIVGSPIVNLINVALMTAVKERASDIHIEPDKRGTRIRYRKDGVLRDLMRPPPGMHAQIAARVKVIGKMDIAEKRLPQGGRVRIVADGQEIDLRVSSMPTLLGEKIVIRVLDKRNLSVRMEELGFRAEALITFTRILEMEHGLALVTGPTGSGKTTTLYSALDVLRSPEVNILTVEDPVEYQLDLVNQIQVSEQIGLTFAKALREILRQDPDVIMVGEIRDHDTARTAIQAALTGHLVLATLHTNDAPSAVSRLVDMGIEPYLLSGALNGVVAQRLARTICPSCTTKYYPTEQVLADAGLEGHAGRAFRKGAGCRNCHDSGFQGRCGIYEIMEVTPDVRRLVHHNAATHDIREKLAERGNLSLRQEGVLLALEGKTSLEEILRVTHNDDDDPGVADRARQGESGATAAKEAA